MDNLKTRFVVFDLETTNNPEKNYKHEIIEIAGIEIAGNKINHDNVFHSLVRPPCRIQPHNYKVSGISDTMVGNAPFIWQVLPKFINFIGSDPLIGHNVSFDMRVLNEHMTDLEYNKVPNISLDTLILSKKIYKTEKSHSLDDIIQRLDIEQSHRERHRALGDVEYTAVIFMKFLDILRQYHITTLRDIKSFCDGSRDLEDFRQLELFK